MDKWLPSRKLVLTFGVLTIVIVGLFIVFLFNKGKIYYKSTNNIDSSLFKNKLNNQNKSNIDTDLDGLKDWEEELWKTDPNNPDTDNDGLNDGDEVEQDRNPLVKGPDDYLGINYKENNNYQEKDETQTNVFLKKISLEYVDLKKGDLLNEQNKEKLIEKNVNEILVNNKEIINEYSLKDLKIVSSNNDSLKEYINGIIKNIFYNDKIQNNVVLLYQSLKENKDNFKDIENSIITYKVIKNYIISMNVPEDLSLKHLELINTLERLIYNSEKMILFNQDPMMAIVAIKNYSEDVDKTEKMFLDIIEYVKTKGVIIDF